MIENLFSSPDTVLELIRTGIFGLALLLMILSYRLMVKTLNMQESNIEILNMKGKLTRFYMILSITIIVLGIIYEASMKVISPSLNLKVNLAPEHIEDFTIKVGAKKYDLKTLQQDEGIEIEHKDVLFLNLQLIKNKIDALQNELKTKKDVETTNFIKINDEGGID